MLLSRRASALLAATAVLVSFAAAQPVRAASPSGKQIASAVRKLKQQYHLRAVYFGVWVGGRRLASGTLGASAPGVKGDAGRPLPHRQHHRDVETTLLLKLVEHGRVSLDDPLSKWWPDLPGADQVTVAMLVPDQAPNLPVCPRPSC